jgi:type VI secretion system protein ImpL
MRSLIGKILKVFLVVTLAVLAVLLVFGIVLALNWPWWVGFFIILGLVGIGIGVFFVGKILRHRREQRFVGEIVAQDELRVKAMAGKEREELQQLQERWKEAMEALRRSHLRKKGNPLYVLPWYLVFGESGSGKTTAIQSARLSSPFAEMNRASGISGTRNCDWWFFEQAILLDTAGRYAIPVDEGRDKDEWQQFLRLLAKYRKREPLNGLIVCVPADKLLQGGKETLQEDGRIIRRRCDELMRVLGAKFPVFVLVTKCDLAQGMTQFCDQLPEKRLEQAMGAINQTLTPEVAAFTKNTVASISERLRDLRLLLLHRTKAQALDPALLLFPEEFEKLEPGLTAFVSGAFEQNPYQETPLLRGLFFSSGRQEGTPYSHFLKALDLIGEKETLPGTSRGLFLHDFFGRILPKDRALFAPTTRALEWSRLTRNLGLASFVAIVIALCGLLSFSFVKNLRTLRDVSNEFAKPPVLQGKVVEDVITMERFRQAILRVGERNRDWWVPRFGLNESLRLEEALKDKYCNQFRTGFLAPFDQQLATTIGTFSPGTQPEVIGQTMVHLVRRINLLKARLEGQGLEGLRSKPQPGYEPIVAEANRAVMADVKDLFGKLYLYYLAWRPDTTQINKEIVDLQRHLTFILTSKSPNLLWIVAWANGQEGLSPVTLASFWEGSAAVQESNPVAPAFTRKGKARVDAILQELDTALPEPGPPLIAKQETEFLAWYRKSYFQAWHDFAVSFPKGVDKLANKDEWKQMVGKMAAGQGPYPALVDAMVQELEPFVGEGEPPVWVGPVFQFHDVKARAAEQMAGKDLSALAKVTQTGKRIAAEMAKVTKQFDKLTGQSAEAQIAQVKAYQDYLKAIAEVAPAASSRKLAYQMGAQVFGEDAATSKSPFYGAEGALLKIKSLMGAGPGVEDVLGSLMAGPFDFLWTFVRQETACQLESQWEQDVIAEVQGAPNWQKLVLGQDGFAWKYLKGPAGPFVARDLKRGFYAKEALGGRIPFDPSFFTFLQRGATAAASTQASYQVQVKGLPTGANPGAQLPSLTSLELQCGTEVQSLPNRNYPIVKNFTWSPDTCGDVVLKIEVGNVTLTKRYPGVQGFPEFLQDFRHGKRTFQAREFPEQQAALKRLGVEYIVVTYQFTGQDRVLGALGAGGTGRLPRTIVTCWDR